MVGGAANFAPWMNGTVAQAFEAKYKTKLVYEGTKSLVNLEKMQKNKDKQYLSVVMMDDPVMILAVKEGLLEKLTPATGAQPRQAAAGRDAHGRHVGQLPAALAGHRLQHQALPDGVPTWADTVRSEVQGPADHPRRCRTPRASRIW